MALDQTLSARIWRTPPSRPAAITSRMAGDGASFENNIIIHTNCSNIFYLFLWPCSLSPTACHLAGQTHIAPLASDRVLFPVDV
ncbi:hypothetical protein DTO166G4_6753 [Paecilomyces variotii]|nr:hypothetical protein DTO166G4_6753 [Paecilomyces variotii]KAJ9238651.1 hypothetical protein DTO166G5_2772 [Paecilomyces variotii]